MRLYHILALVLLLAAGPAVAADAGKAGVMSGILTVTDPQKGTVTLAMTAPFNDRTLTVADPAASDLLAMAKTGDVVWFTSDDRTNPTRLDRLQEARRLVGRGPRLIVFFAALVLVALLAWAFLGRSPLYFLIGKDNRYSNSQTQMALWFWALATVYLATLVLRILYLGFNFTGGIEIPTNLLALTGLSALSFGGAKVITTQKIANALQAPAAAAAPIPPKPPATTPHLLLDLVQNDNREADLGDFEMILIALAAIGVFGLTSFHFLGALQLAPQVTLPDIDTTLLASFGIGHGAYLVKKAALGLGDG